MAPITLVPASLGTIKSEDGSAAFNLKQVSLVEILERVRRIKRWKKKRAFALVTLYARDKRPAGSQSASGISDEHLSLGPPVL